MHKFSQTCNIAKLAKLSFNALCMMLAITAQAVYVPPSNQTPTVPVTTVVATASGSITGKTVSAELTIKSADQGAHGSIFVAVVLPSSLGGGAYFLSDLGKWVPYSTCSTTPAYLSGVLPNSLVIPVVSSFDLSGLVGAQVYVGYGGADPLGAAPGAACSYMLSNGTYFLAYTVVP